MIEKIFIIMIILVLLISCTLIKPEIMISDNNIESNISTYIGTKPNSLNNIITKHIKKDIKTDYKKLLDLSDNELVVIHDKYILETELENIGKVKIIPVTVYWDRNNHSNDIKNQDINDYDIKNHLYLDEPIIENSDKLYLFMLKENNSYEIIFWSGYNAIDKYYKVNNPDDLGSHFYYFFLMDGFISLAKQYSDYDNISEYTKVIALELNTVPIGQNAFKNSSVKIIFVEVDNKFEIIDVIYNEYQQSLERIYKKIE